jgi:hypothetical protein
MQQYTCSWNIDESGVKHHQTNKQTNKETVIGTDCIDVGSCKFNYMYDVPYNHDDDGPGNKCDINI